MKKSKKIILALFMLALSLQFSGINNVAARLIIPPPPEEPLVFVLTPSDFSCDSGDSISMTWKAGSGYPNGRSSKLYRSEDNLNWELIDSKGPWGDFPLSIMYSTQAPFVYGEDNKVYYYRIRVTDSSSSITHTVEVTVSGVPTPLHFTETPTNIDCDSGDSVDFVWKGSSDYYTERTAKLYKIFWGQPILVIGSLQEDWSNDADIRYTISAPTLDYDEISVRDYEIRLTDSSWTIIDSVRLTTHGLPFPDDDNDLMNDDWEDANGLNSAINDASEDPDNDGLVNLDEYYQETDPQNCYDPIGQHFEDDNIGDLPSNWDFDYPDDFQIVNLVDGFNNRYSGNILEMDTEDIWSYFSRDDYNFDFYDPVLLSFDFAITGSISETTIDLLLYDGSTEQFSVKITDGQIKVFDLGFQEIFSGLNNNQLYNLKIAFEKGNGNGPDYVILLDYDIIYMSTVQNDLRNLNKIEFTISKGDSDSKFYFDNLFLDSVDKVINGRQEIVRDYKYFTRLYLNHDYNTIAPLYKYLNMKSVDLSIDLDIGYNLDIVEFGSGNDHKFGFNCGSLNLNSINLYDSTTFEDGDVSPCFDEDIIVFMSTQAEYEMCQLKMENTVILEIPLKFNFVETKFSTCNPETWLELIGDPAPNPLEDPQQNLVFKTDSISISDSDDKEVIYDIFESHSHTNFEIGFSFSFYGISIGAGFNINVHEEELIQSGVRIRPEGHGTYEYEYAYIYDEAAYMGISTYLVNLISYTPS